VAIDAPPRNEPFGLRIVIEANEPRFAVRWEGMADETMPPISVDRTPARAVETLRSELADDRLEWMPVSLVVDRQVPWSFVAQIAQVAQATHHLRANFAFVTSQGAAKTWVTIELGPGGALVALPGDTEWSDAHVRVLAAARAGKRVELL